MARVYNLTLAGNFHSYAGSRALEVAQAISEALSWLEREALVTAEPGEFLRICLTRRALQLRTPADFDAFKQARLLPTELDPGLAQKIRAPFVRGDYEFPGF